MIHALLEALPDVPQADWPGFSLNLLRHIDQAVTEAELSPWLQEASALLTDDGLAHLFAKEALAEVPITGPVGPLGPMHAILDRLIITPEVITVVDFKTNRTVPQTPHDCPEGLLRQMGAYAEMLTQIYPEHRIETALLWTRNAEFMRLPHDLVTAALQRAYLDLTPATP
jgi:ATP-dependent helicase/nuclease subunit A